MLKRDPSAKFAYKDVGFINRKRLVYFYAGKLHTQNGLEYGNYTDLIEIQKSNPVPVMKVESTKRCWWMFKDEFYWEDEGYTQTEVKVLILDRLNQKEKKVQRANARLTQAETEPVKRREPIPDDVKLFGLSRLERDYGQKAMRMCNRKLSKL